MTRRMNSWLTAKVISVLRRLSFRTRLPTES